MIQQQIDSTHLRFESVMALGIDRMLKLTEEQLDPGVLEALGKESLRRGKPPGDNEDLIRFDFNPGDEKDPAAMLKALKEMVEKYKKKETAEPEQ